MTTSATIQPICEIITDFSETFHNLDWVKHGNILDVDFVSMSPVSAAEKYTNQPLLGWSEFEKLTGEIQVSVDTLNDMDQKIVA